VNVSPGIDRTGTDEALRVAYPFDGSIVGEVRAMSSSEATAVTEQARRFRSDLSAHERSALLAATADDVEARTEVFARSITLESGLALRDARAEVQRAVGNLRVCAEEAKQIRGETTTTDTTATGTRRMAVTWREPVGVVLAITPFNRPLNQVVVKVGPAIAANNTVVVKPSEKTPLTALLLVETLLACGMPAEMLTVVTGRPEEVGDALVMSPHVDMVTFTGSAAVGASIAGKVGMVRTLFELGDSGSIVVLADADLEAAADATARGAFASSGQSCRGVKRVIVEESVADELVELVTERAAALRVGNPLQGGIDLGTMIDEEAARLVEARIDAAVAAGAELVFGGQRRGAQMWPAVIDRVRPDDDLVREETFGPCAPVLRVAGAEEAFACVNATRFGLQAGLFTNRLDRAMEAARRFDVGTIVLNDGPQFDSPAIPFGGVKASGLGREGPRYAIHEMTQLKTLVL